MDPPSSRRWFAHEGVPVIRSDYPRNEPNFPFRQLCKDGDLTKVKDYLENQTEMEDWESNTQAESDIYDGFLEAIRGGHLDVVKYLAEKGCSLSEIVSAAVHRAVSSGNTNVLDFLVEQGWNPKQSRITESEEHDPKEFQFSHIR
jgi:phage terminase large subunit-like protein